MSRRNDNCHIFCQGFYRAAAAVHIAEIFVLIWSERWLSEFDLIWLSRQRYISLKKQKKRPEICVWIYLKKIRKCLNCDVCDTFDDQPFQIETQQQSYRSRIDGKHLFYAFEHADDSIELMSSDEWNDYAAHIQSADKCWWFKSCYVTYVVSFMWTKKCIQKLNRNGFFVKCDEKPMNIFGIVPFSTRPKNSLASILMHPMCDKPRIIPFYMKSVDDNSFYCRQIGRNGECW